MPMLLVAAAICMSPSIHDGDTIRCGSERIRIRNIDAPEMPDSPKCHDNRTAYAWCDYKAGAAAKAALIQFLTKGTIYIERTGTDKYGRTLATIRVNGADAGDYLIGKGLAKPWR